jgi:hypothetical protein
MTATTSASGSVWRSAKFSAPALKPASGATWKKRNRSPSVRAVGLDRAPDASSFVLLSIDETSKSG